MSEETGYFYQDEEKTLSDKIMVSYKDRDPNMTIEGSEHIPLKDVKEKIQNTQRRIKGWLLNKVEKNPKGKVTVAELNEEMNKIFLEEFGEKILGVEE